MLRLQISCVEKDNHDNVYERIRYIGGRYAGVRWRMFSANAIELIEKGRYSFYVFCEDRETDVVVAVKNGRKYLKTVADYDLPLNLLTLAEC